MITEINRFTRNTGLERNPGVVHRIMGDRPGTPASGVLKGRHRCTQIMVPTLLRDLTSTSHRVFGPSLGLALEQSANERTDVAPLASFGDTTPPCLDRSS